jgi:hypothetical protein
MQFFRVWLMNGGILGTPPARGRVHPKKGGVVMVSKSF